jgi:hypothetical protein
LSSVATTKKNEFELLFSLDKSSLSDRWWDTV